MPTRRQPLARRSHVATEGNRRGHGWLVFAAGASAAVAAAWRPAKSLFLSFATPYVGSSGMCGHGGSSGCHVSSLRGGGRIGSTLFGPEPAEPFTSLSARERDTAYSFDTGYTESAQDGDEELENAKTVGELKYFGVTALDGIGLLSDEEVAALDSSAGVEALEEEADVAPPAAEETQPSLDTADADSDVVVSVVDEPVDPLALRVDTDSKADPTEGRRLLPGDVVAAQLPADGAYAKLVDGRGWLRIGEGVEEVDPWAAKIMKKPGIDKDDAQSLAYLSLDTSSLTPLAEHLPLPQRVIDNLVARGVDKASPIQETVFDRIHHGESMCLQAQTGTGKTLAMILPLLTAMSEESVWGEEGDKIIVITSNRELAVQLYSDIEGMGFFPPNQGFATLLIVGNVPPKDSILKANVIIGNPNELGGFLHKDEDIIMQLSMKLRAVVLDEVDDYMTAPNLFASTWSIKKKRKLFNERKGYLLDKNGVIEIFMKRQLAYSRRSDLQVLAASATLSRPIARKLFRVLRWDPLGRWYSKPPPLVRPVAANGIDWQSVPRVPTIPMDLKHRYVPIVRYKTDTAFSNKHDARSSYEHSGIRRLKIRAAAGQTRGKPGGSQSRAVSKLLATSMLDGLHDALKSRKKGAGSSMVIVTRSMGITVRELVRLMHSWGFHEAQSMHKALWEDPNDWPSRWAEKFNYDEKDHSAKIGTRHAMLAERMQTAEMEPFPLGSKEEKMLTARQEAGENVAPILVGYEAMGRGIHFDGIDTVFMVGLPRKPAVYLHLAGRVGRLGQKSGKVVSVVSKRGAKVLRSWQNQIGPGVKFRQEHISRFRSRDPDEKSNRERQKALDKRMLAEHARQAKREEEDAEEAVPLLPEPEEKVYMPGMAPGDRKKDRVVERELMEIRESVRRSAKRDDVAARRLRARLQRITKPV
eukprot:TRINITY_DN83071_c0_g1_i1.p1 TRINITY_DN83071_c0_g1~~TRINITY_DN83071_c0_g1_i1.p1  ORF type:complete len:938 (+),score=194.47 TRINITY_DN83071_c0_g1_i1:41-2815(+)